MNAHDHDNAYPDFDLDDPDDGRSRVVVVGPEELADRISGAAAAAHTHISIARTPSYLAAMGDVATTPADVVIGTAEALHGQAASMADGLRRLAPKARLVVLADAASKLTPESAIRAGFDDYLIEPVDTSHLAAVLSAKSHGTPAHAPTPTQQAIEPREPIDMDQQPPPAQHVADTDLGDVDLVDEVLSGRGGLPQMAMRIVTSRCDIAGITWMPSDGDVPHDHRSALVTYAGHAYGILHAPPPASQQQLDAWAAWLSRWLALHEQIDQLKDMAMRDDLTGAWNRRYFYRFLTRILSRAEQDRSQVTVMVFDIDDFKRYNDHYGHAAGDDILQETARLMQSVVREHDVVARIGGDEFAVIFWDAEGPRRPNSQHPTQVPEAAQRFQAAICAHRFPKLLDEAPGTLTISGGLASFPWDGRTPDDLVRKADEMSLQSKRQGKNVITYGPGAQRVCQVDAS